MKGATSKIGTKINSSVKSLGEGLGYLLTGDILVKKKFLKQIPFLVFLLMLSLFYVNNRFSYEAELKELSNLKSELVDKRYRSLTISKELMEMGRQSRIQQRLEDMGSDLQEATTPLIIIKK